METTKAFGLHLSEQQPKLYVGPFELRLEPELPRCEEQGHEEAQGSGTLGLTPKTILSFGPVIGGAASKISEMRSHGRCESEGGLGGICALDHYGSAPDERIEGVDSGTEGTRSLQGYSCHMSYHSSKALAKASHPSADSTETEPHPTVSSLQHLMQGLALPDANKRLWTMVSRGVHCPASCHSCPLRQQTQPTQLQEGRCQHPLAHGLALSYFVSTGLPLPCLTTALSPSPRFRGSAHLLHQRPWLPHTLQAMSCSNSSELHLPSP
ncbi:uncharacterized protein [Macaca nemestrina]|uniref:uncharacterized protein n=1 Tax=Macaca nemestrina TaxID=9545 RepID=UPI0039B950DA